MLYRYDEDCVRKAYDKTAARYAEAFARELEQKHFDRLILSWFATQVPAPRRALDLGMGHGHTTAFLAARGIRVTGVDLSEAMVVQARQAFPHAEFKVGNMLALDEEPGSVGAILAYYSIVHFDQDTLGKAFSEMGRVMAPGGLLLFTFHLREGEALIHTDAFLDVEGAAVDWVFFDLPFVLECLRQTDFDVIDSLIRQPYPELEDESQRAYVIARFRGKTADREGILEDGRATLISAT